MDADIFAARTLQTFHQNYLRPSAVKASFFFASIRVHSRLIDVYSRLHHGAESSDHLGETSGYLAKRTMLNTVNQLGEGVTSLLHDRG